MRRAMRHVLVALLLALPIVAAAPAAEAWSPDPDHLTICPRPLTYQAWACFERDNTWYCYEIWLGMTVTRDCFQFVGP